MSIVATNQGGGGSFEPVTSGQHAAVCCDVEDLGFQDTPWGEKHKVRLRWIVAERDSSDRPKSALKHYTLSLHEKAILRLDLESWLGRELNEDELAGFDLETLLGKKALLNIVQVNKSNRVFANVRAIGPLPAAMSAPKIPSDYERRGGGIPQTPVQRAVKALGAVAMADEESDLPF